MVQASGVVMVDEAMIKIVVLLKQRYILLESFMENSEVIVATKNRNIRLEGPMLH